MPDLASLSFDIDSSQAQRAIAVLETLKASSITVTQAAQQQNNAQAALTQSYGQQRDALVRLADQTKTYDGTLQGLISRLDQLRSKLNDSQQAFTAYNTVLAQTVAQATSFNATVDGLDRYVSKARELRVQINDLATGFDRMTAALKNQTVAGHDALVTLNQLGVQTTGISADRPDLLMQRFMARLQSLPMTAGTLQGAQQIMGPSFDAQALMGAGAPRYIPYQERREQDRQRQAAAEVDQVRSQAQLMRDTLRYQRDELTDLRQRFTLVPTFAGRSGLAIEPGPVSIGGMVQAAGQGLGAAVGAGGGFLGAAAARAPIERYFDTRISAEEELRRLRAVDQMSPVERARFERPTEVLNQMRDTDPWQRQYRHWTQGTYGAYANEIGARQDLDAFRSPYGAAGALGARMGRDLQNVLPAIFGDYQPLYRRDPRELSEYERNLVQAEGGDILAQYGDPSLRNMVVTRNQMGQFGQNEMRERYRSAFSYLGPGYAEQRYNTQAAAVEQAARYGRQPGTAEQTLESINRQRSLMSLPIEQRAAAQAALQFGLEQPGGSAKINQYVTPGSPIGAFTQPSWVDQRQQQAMTAAEEARREGIIQPQSEDTKQQIEFQKNLAEELTKGRAAAEDFTRSWQTYQQALHDGLISEEREARIRETLSIAMRQRITQGQAMVVQLRSENALTEERVARNRTLLTSDPITRMAAQAALSITQGQRAAIEAGTLPNVAGEFRDPLTGNVIRNVAPPEAEILRQRDLTERQRQLALTGVQGAQGTTTGIADQARDADQLAQIMRTQNVSLNEAQRVLAVNKQYQGDIAKAMQDQDTAALKMAESLRQQGVELDRNRALAEQMTRNIQTGQQALETAIGNQILQNADPRMRPYLQALIPLAIQNMGAGAGVAPTPQMDPARLQRSNDFRSQVQGGMGLTPEASAAAAGWGIGESGLMGVNETNPAVPGSRGGLGIFQWTGEANSSNPRRAQFEEYLRRTGQDASSPAANRGFFEEDMRLRYPHLLRELQTPGRTVAQQSATMATYVAGSQTGDLALRYGPGRTALAQQIYAGSYTGAAGAGAPAAPGAAAGGAAGPNAGGPARAPLDVNKVMAVVTKMVNNQPFEDEFTGTTADQRQAILDAAHKVMASVRTGQQLSTTEVLEQARTQLGVIQQQIPLQQQGRAGEAARIVPLPQGMDIDLARLQQAAQRSLVVAGQREQGAQLTGQTSISLRQGQATLTALGGPMEGYESRARAAAAANQVLAESSRLSADSFDRMKRAGDLATEMLQREQEAAGRAAQQTREGNAVSQTVMNRGIFATDEDLRRTAAMAPFDITRQTNPELAATQQQKDKETAEKAKQDLLDQMDVVQRYRDVWRGAGQATENALLAVLVHGESAKRTLTGLVQQLADMAIKAFIFKPLENSFGNLLSGNTSGGGFFDFLGKLPGVLSGSGEVGAAGPVGSGLLSGGLGLNATGGVFTSSDLSRFSGSIVSKPTMFRFASGMGLMGEAGPEAIMPLVRTSSGNLGVRSDSGGAPTIHINTPITVNGGGGGGGGGQPMDPRAMAELQRRLDTQVRTSVRTVLTEQRRPGGDLFGSR